MMGCTDRHCRYLFRLLSPNSLLYSEMLTTGALIHGPRDQLLAHREDTPAVLQLGGSNPEELARCAVYIEEAGYQEVNLNCGCPSDRVQQGGIGACLMAQPDVVAECFTAMNEATTLPVSIKSRIGIDDQDSFEFFEAFIKPIYEAGCRQFVVHARKAVLDGLSPKENREIPPLHYEFVSRIQTMFPDATFVLNGGISTVNEVMVLLDEFPGVMLGRAPYSAPYLLAELDHAIFGTALPDRMEVISAYRRYMVEEMDAGTHLKHMAKHLFGLFPGYPGARAYRRHLSTYMNAADADISVLDGAIAMLNVQKRMELAS